MADPNILTNNYFKVLSWMYDEKDSEDLVKVTQLELAESIGLSRPTINIIFNKLKDAGYLIHNDKRVGHYYLTEDAIKIIKIFRKNDRR